MAWQKPNQQQEQRVNPESFVTKALDNVIDYDFMVATTSDKETSARLISEYPERFVWLVNFAEGVCIGAGLIKTNNNCIDYEALSPEELNFLDAARKLFALRYSKTQGTAAANVERKARSALEEVVSGAYDAKRNQKEMELKQLVDEKKMLPDKLDLELARYRFQLMIEAAEAKKTIRKEMNQ